MFQKYFLTITSYHRVPSHAIYFICCIFILITFFCVCVFWTHLVYWYLFSHVCQKALYTYLPSGRCGVVYLKPQILRRLRQEDYLSPEVQIQTGQYKIPFQKHQTRGWRDGLRANSTVCFSRGLGFNTQHPRSHSQVEIWYLLLPSTRTRYVCGTDVYAGETNTHTQYINNFFKNRETGGWRDGLAFRNTCYSSRGMKSIRTT